MGADRGGGWGRMGFGGAPPAVPPQAAGSDGVIATPGLAKQPASRSHRPTHPAPGLTAAASNPGNPQLR